MKKRIFLILIFSSTIFISCYYIIKNLTKFNNSEINTYMAFNLQIDKLLNPISLKGKSIREIRQTLDKQSVKWSKEPILLTNIKNLMITSGSLKIPVRIYTPDTGSNLPIIIYAHGGFWMGGNTDTHDNICRKLSKQSKAIVISVNYRLAPENPYPAGLNDIYAILQWASQNFQSINGDKNRIAVAGDSSGGNLSAAVSLMSRDNNGPRIRCLVLIYPALNLYSLCSRSWLAFENKFNVSLEDMEKYISLYISKKEDRKLPYASPVLADNLNKLPKTLIISAEIDPLIDDEKLFADKLKKAGNEVNLIEYKGVVHGFISMDKVTNKADDAINEISSYLRKEFQVK